VQFAIKTFIVRMGGLNDVGLYEAGWALNTTYLGLVFTAMAKDYYPRLSQIAGDNAQVKVMMNQQTEIALVLLAPLIIIMIVFMSFFIRLLYSAEFLAIVPMTKWLLIGALVRAGAWGTSFVFLAKGDGKLFLFNELGIKIITLPSYLLCYYWFGLVGIGYANVFNFLIYFLWVGIVAYRKYKISYSPIFWKLFITFLSIILLYPIGEQLWNAKYLTGIAITLCICGLSLYEFNKRIDIRDFWANIVSRFKSNKQ
jgi:O-antigen/teichoic acid export membrane protein